VAHPDELFKKIELAEIDQFFEDSSLLNPIFSSALILPQNPHHFVFTTLGSSWLNPNFFFWGFATCAHYATPLVRICGSTQTM